MFNFFLQAHSTEMGLGPVPTSCFENICPCVPNFPSRHTAGELAPHQSF